MTAVPGEPHPAPRVLVVMGPAGAGKSTLARQLTRRLGWDLAEGDEFHRPESIASMRGGTPLDDDARGPWLRDVATWIDEQLATGRGGVVACSALKRSYRDQLRRRGVAFVNLQCPPTVLRERLEARREHFAGAGLLASQLEALEPPSSDEDAVAVDATATPVEQADRVIRALALDARKELRMQIGIVGLGRMGGGIARKLRDAGHDVVGYDASADSERDVDALEGLVAALAAPRVVWVMVPAGDATRETVAALARILQPGDTVVDGGNSRYVDDAAHAQLLGDAGIAYVDVGVSGGVHGREHGYALMSGGADEHVEAIAPLLDTLAAPAGGHVHVGPTGGGHFAKMVHNGIEYGIMQAYGEGFELLGASDLVTSPDDVMRAWRDGTVIRSWLLDLLCSELDRDPSLAATAAQAEDSGEGRWMVQAGVEHGVPLPVTSAALYARFASRGGSDAMRVVAALRRGFGGHATRREAR